MSAPARDNRIHVARQRTTLQQPYGLGGTPSLVPKRAHVRWHQVGREKIPMVVRSSAPMRSQNARPATF
jgi:hypothetical protein